MLAEIALWWVGQMRALARPLLPPAPSLPDALIVAMDGLDDEGTLLLRRDGKETGLHSLAHGRAPATPSGLATGLRLPPGLVLSRELTLPLAAARDLRTLVGFELDRLTPFAADELYWGVSGIVQDRARARLVCTISIALRSQVEALRAKLAVFNLAPSFIEAGAGRIELSGVAPPPAQHWRMGLAGLCGVLALACIVTPFVRQQIALNDAAQIIADAAPAAHVAQGLRQQLAAAAQGRAAITQARHQGDALQVLATLTDALPDDTFLSDLTLKNGDLSFDGQSANAAQLIGLLSSVPGLRDPSFTAPVTRTADGKADIFALHATVSE